MLKERYDAIIEEISEVESLAELNALRSCSEDYAEPAFAPLFDAAVVRLTNKEEPKMDSAEVDLASKVADLLAQIESIRAGATTPPPVKPVVRGGKRYVLLKTEVDWSTKPQVHALMEVIKAHANVGDTMDEADIVAWCVANEHVLNTRQGGKRIWDYYKGDHAEGLVAHGNIRRV